MESRPLVVPVRFSGGGLSMQTTTSRLSLDGAFIRCFVAPKEGAPIKLELTLPHAAQPVEVSGSVSERVQSADRGKETGFGVRFDPLSAEARAALEGVLVDRSPRSARPAAPAAPAPAAPAAASNTRAFARVRTRLQVGWSTPREFLVAYSENISRGGIFVATARPPELREVVELLLDLPDGDVPAKTNAEVVRRVTPEESKRSGRPAGAGLQFVGSDDEFRRRLDLCFENLLEA